MNEEEELMKRCTRCGLLLKLKFFHKTGRNQRRADCMWCRADRFGSEATKSKEAISRKRAHNRAYARAKTRMSKIHPELFDRLLIEELYKEGIDRRKDLV